VFAGFRYLLVGRQTPVRRLIGSHLQPRPHERVLDVCCGVGQFAEEVSGRYVGVDLSISFVRAGASRFKGDPQKRFAVMDALQLSFPDRVFDKAMCLAALHHFSDEASRRVLAEMRRVTRRRILIMDADGKPRRRLQRALVATDRGRWMRAPSDLEALVRSVLPVARVVPVRIGLYDVVVYDCPLAPDEEDVAASHA